MNKLSQTIYIFIFLSISFIIGSFVNAANTDFTISAWTKPQGATTTMAIVVKDDEVRLVTDASNQVSCQIYNGSAWQAGATSSVALTANEWAFTTCVYSGSSLKIYINGIEKASLSETSEVNDTTNVFRIGSDASGDYNDFSGYIDEVKVYPYARTADQVRQDYNAGLAGVETPRGASATFGSQSDKWLTDGLVGYWKMDETATTSGAIDASGNGNTGTYNGNASTTAGKFGFGGVFASSSSDYVNVTDSQSLNPNQITLSAWVKSDSAGGYIIAKDPPSSDQVQASSDQVQTSLDQAQVQPEIEKKEIANQTSKTEKIKNYAKNHKDIFAITAFFYLALFFLGIYKLKSQVIGDKLVIGVLALSGAAALIYEVAATQALTYFFNSSSYSVATAIISFLLGLALGSFIISKYLLKIIHPIRLLIVMQILAGIYALLVFPQYYQIVSVLPFFYDIVADSSVLTLGIKFFVGIIFLLFPTIMLGASFPLASALIIKDVKTAGSDVGRLYSWDLIGAVLGALVSGFILLPKFGLTIAFAFGAVMNIFAGLLLCNIKKRKMVLALLGLALFVPLIIFATGKQNLIAVPAVSGIVEMEPVLDKDVLFKKESAFGEILVSNKNERPALSISKIVQCDTNYPPLLKNLNAVLSILPAQERALDVGLGCGYSANAIASSSNIKNLDIVEINPVLTNTLKYFNNDGLLSNDKVVLNNDDIMHFLARTQNVYDFVNVELNMPSLSQVSPFYSKEYFRLLKQKVSQDGTIRLWVCCGNYEFVKTVYKTLGEVYEDIVIKSDMDGRAGRDYYYNTEFIIGAGAKSFKQNTAEKKLQTRVENDQDFKISTLDNQLIGEIWYDWSQKNYKDYFVQPVKTVQDEKPLIEDAYLFPLDVKPGDMMDAGARVLDKNGIQSVKISFPHEKGEDWVNLELSEGTIYDGLWKGEWLAHDTIDKTYLSRLVAENKEEVTEEKVIEWSDLIAPEECTASYINSSTFSANVGESVSVECSGNYVCDLAIEDDTSGSYSTIPNNDIDVDCNGSDCFNSGLTTLTRDIACVAAGIYNIRCTALGAIAIEYYDLATLTCNSVSKQDVPYALSIVNGGQFLIKSGGTDYTVDSVTDINDGEWHHLVGTYDGTAMKLFVDGKLEDTNTGYSGDLPVVAGDLHIGADYEENPGNFFDGSIDEARVYNRALSDAEVQRLYEWAPGPVLHLKMDEMSGTTTWDNSGYGNDGSFVSDATSPNWTQLGRYGSALDFDGVDDYVDVVNDLSLTSDNITVSSWFKVNSFKTAPQTLVSKINVSGQDGFLLAVAASNDATNPNKVYFAVTDAGSSFGVYGDVIELDRWYYALGTVQDGVLHFYLDGILQGEETGTSIGANADNLKVGMLYNIYNFDGELDDVRVYNYARTQKQILEDMNGGGPAVKSPVLYLNFDEGYGETVHDSSIYGNNGTAYVGTGGTQTATSSMWEKNGKVGGAMEFDRIDDHVDVPHSASLVPDDITFSAWFKVDALDTSPQYFISKFNISATNGYTMGIKESSDATNPNEVYVAVTDSGVTTGVFGETVEIDRWYHALVTFNNGTLKFYLNGELQGATSSASIGANTDNFVVGRLFQVYPFGGAVDEVKVWNFALTEDEIKQEYNGGSAFVIGGGNTPANDNGTVVTGASTEYCIPGDTATCTPPVLELKMDEMSGGTVYDTSGQGNDGTISGVSWETVGKYGSGLSFDGSDDYVDIGDISNNLKTISFWLKANSLTEDILDLDGGTNTITVSAGTVSANNFVSPIIYVNSLVSSTINQQIWQYITVITDTNIDVNNFDIGRISSSYYDGIMDDIKIYDYARTPAQIAWDYNRGKPMAEYRFDECSGSTIHNYIDNTNNGTLMLGSSGVTATGTCASSSNSFWYNGKTGKKNSGGSFDGTDDYINIGDTGLNINSVSFWFKQDYTDNNMIDLGGGNYTVTLADSVVTATGFSSPTIYVDGINKTTVPDNAWHHILVTTATAIDASSTKIGLVGSDYFTGQIDEVKLYNYALTSVQAKTDFSGSAVGFGYSGVESGSALVSSWTCGTDEITDIDENSYATVLIGDQCWMAENLMVSKNADGMAVNGTGDTDTTPPVAYSDGNWEAVEGYLYNWQDAMNGATAEGAQGICMDGWHVPTDAEWVDLEVYICEQEGGSGCVARFTGTTGYRGVNNEGRELKSTTNVNGQAGLTNGDDGYGFAGLLAGYHDTNGSFNHRGTSGLFWSSSEDVSNAWYRNLNSSVAGVNRNNAGKGVGFSVRCLKD